MQHNLKETFTNSRILCVGDVMVDRFVYGNVNRISPESPIPVLQSQRNFTVLGGAGNVARNLLSLGATCHLLTVSGDDQTADELETLLMNERNLKTFVVRDINRITTCKTRFIASGQQMLRVDNEITTIIDQDTQSQLLELFTKKIIETNVVILSDYAKGIFDDQFCQTLIQIAKAAGASVIIDPKGKNYDRYRDATLLTPNIKELSEAVKHPIQSHHDLVVAAQDLCKELNITAMLVTQGADGMTLVTEEGFTHIPTEAKEIFDVSGAGDTVISTLATALSANLSLLDAAKLANKAAGIAVGKVGTATVTVDELQAALENEAHTTTTFGGVYSKAGALECIKMWRRQGLTVGFTNGCFDLLHLGHLHILKKAAAVCDRLIVGVNSDASVKRLKGETRPIQNEETRSEVLATLNCVDAVVVFDEPTPLQLIELFEPDVLIKGADYTIDRVVGAQVVQARGGKVVLIDLKQGHSTTTTIKRMT